MKKIITLIGFALLMSSCSNDGDTKNITISFENKIAGDRINLGTGNYQNTSNESYSIDELKYIISNIQLVKENGEVFTYPQDNSYFLINESEPESQIIVLNNVPAQDFQTLKFGIGIDQTNYPLNGVDNFVPTAEENQMLWSWSAGYIFFKIEGDFSIENEGHQDNFLFHIGSHGTNLDNYKTVELSATQFDLDLTRKDLIAIETDISKLFNAVHDIRINDKPDIQVDPVNAPKIAENASQMFSLKPTHSTN